MMGAHGVLHDCRLHCLMCSLCYRLFCDWIFNTSEGQQENLLRFAISGQLVFCAVRVIFADSTKLLNQASEVLMRVTNCHDNERAQRLFSRDLVRKEEFYSLRCRPTTCGLSWHVSDGLGSRTQWRSSHGKKKRFIEPVINPSGLMVHS